MIDAPGIVTALDGDFAIVRMEESGCGRCHETGGCGGNNIGRLFCSAPRSFRVLNPGKSSPGDRVVVAIDEGALRRSALMCYGLPLLALFIGAFCGSALAGETGAILGAICGLFSSWLLLRYALRRQTPDQRSQPFIRS
ncbi:SoxR reducing system RseC family protein [Propionivibrio sp.]|uniref:SoxR reducing system RseC family protein n=1 Tax=Propionivibrio sp. TaxID=2212460 RepID=UPI0025E74606|nr:SoxR reducing system RseC family protein [Propionivibrio sp.]MBK7356534.1 SoxR reducing system RseC family protein [Propionivibrio sp.]MBK8400948.1 SoxR reducing system RseC family protein [Propionivibrio sp.]MBK8745260.1 SoxR reducing system RseC family protein [Propionivibrio sp.]MBK8894233.1 SoxR reducing system RseC family protein [Propionivibrio sp.]